MLGETARKQAGRDRLAIRLGDQVSKQSEWTDEQAVKAGQTRKQAERVKLAGRLGRAD